MNHVHFILLLDLQEGGGMTVSDLSSYFMGLGLVTADQRAGGDSSSNQQQSQQQHQQPPVLAAPPPHHPHNYQPAQPPSAAAYWQPQQQSSPIQVIHCTNQSLYYSHIGCSQSP